MKESDYAAPGAFSVFETNIAREDEVIGHNCIGQLTSVAPPSPSNAYFDAFAPAPTETSLAFGVTPMPQMRVHQPVAPRKFTASACCSPEQVDPNASIAPHPQSCPPCRPLKSNRGTFIKARVKRSLGLLTSAKPRENLLHVDAAGRTPNILAGIARKRIDADLLSPPLLPRKSSRTLEDGAAAELIFRIKLGDESIMECDEIVCCNK